MFFGFSSITLYTFFYIADIVSCQSFEFIETHFINRLIGRYMIHQGHDQGKKKDLRIRIQTFIWKVKKVLIRLQVCVH